MQEIDRLTMELCNAINESDVYKDYLKAYNALLQYPSLLRETNELRRQNFELQNSNDMEGMFDRIEVFRKRYAELRKHEVVSNFLQAELCLFRLVQSVCTSIAGSLDFDVSFLDE